MNKEVKYIFVMIILVSVLVLAYSTQVNAESEENSLWDEAIWLENDNIDIVYDFYDGYAVVKNKEGKYGVIDQNGDLVINFLYDGMGHHTDGLIKVMKVVRGEYEWAYINPKNEEIIPFEEVYSFFGGRVNSFGVSEFREGLAYVRKERVKGFIDKNGDMKITFDNEMTHYDSEPEFSQGLSVVGKDQKYGYINKQGDVVVPFQFDRAVSYQDGYAAVKLNGKWGAIDLEGNMVVPAVYERISSFQDGYATALIGDSSSNTCTIVVVDTSGRELFELGCSPYREIKLPEFSDGLFRDTIRYGKTIYYNSSGQVMLETEWIDGGVFHEGLASFVATNKPRREVGFMDKNGEIVIAPTEDISRPGFSGSVVDSIYFQDGFAVFKHAYRGFGIIENPIARAKRLEEEEASRQKAEAETAAKLKAAEKAKEEAQQRKQEAAKEKTNSEIVVSVDSTATQAVNVKQVSMKEGGSSTPVKIGFLFLILVVGGITLYFIKMRRK